MIKYKTVTSKQKSIAITVFGVIVILVFTAALTTDFFVWICAVNPLLNAAIAIVSSVCAFLLAGLINKIQEVELVTLIQSDGIVAIVKKGCKIVLVTYTAVISGAFLLMLGQGLFIPLGGTLGYVNALSLKLLFCLSAVIWVLCVIFNNQNSQKLQAIFPAVMVSIKSCEYFLSHNLWQIKYMLWALAPALIVLIILLARKNLKNGNKQLKPL